MRNRGSTSTSIVRSLALISGIALLATACGNAAESGLEQLIEQQSGGDVDLDLGGDGGFSIQTEEGGLSVDEDGNFTITGEDGEVITGSAGQDGSFTIEGEDGSITGSEDNGDFSIESDEGSFTISGGNEMPSEWPGDVPQPDGLEITTSSVIGSDNDLIITLVGTTSQNAADYVDSYGAALSTSGFEQTSSFESDGGVVRSFSNGTWEVSASAFEVPGSDPQISINLFKST